VPSFQDDAPSLTNAIVGKWLWCDGPWGDIAGGNVGIEFAAGNTFYGLSEDLNGNITRGTGETSYGTYSFVPTPDAGLSVGRQPLTLMLNPAMGQEPVMQVVYYAEPRALMFGFEVAGFMTTYEGETVATQNIYGTLEPLP
jgi:hypothetical protein